jgi:hypothetical protein
MPWSNTSRRSTRYGRPHQAERERHMRELRRVGTGICAETRNPGSRCVERSPVITPAMSLHLCHNSRTGEVLGLGHARCNIREAASRGNRMRYHRHRQPAPAPRARTDRSW